MSFPVFLKMNKCNSFLPTFSKIKQKYFLISLFRPLISQKLCHFELQNKIHIIRIKKLNFIQLKLQRLLKYLLSYIFLMSNAPIFSGQRKYFFLGNYIFQFLTLNCQCNSEVSSLSDCKWSLVL